MFTIYTYNFVSEDLLKKYRGTGHKYYSIIVDDEDGDDEEERIQHEKTSYRFQKNVQSNFV